MHTRVLCLGNDLLADDAIGPCVARYLKQFPLPDAEVVESAESGLRLLDYLDTDNLIVVDAIASGAAPPGTIHILEPHQLSAGMGVSPHYTGLQEALLLGRALGIAIPRKVTLLAVEAADCTSVGGAMSPCVEQAIARVVGLIRRDLETQAAHMAVALGGPS